jgi:hypothetical protein
VSQALHHHYLTQHFLNTFADVFAESEAKWMKNSSRRGKDEGWGQFVGGLGVEFAYYQLSVSVSV